MSEYRVSVPGTGNPAQAQGHAPGDLISYEEITALDDPSFPPGARAWRVLYVSTGRDNTDLTLVAGVVVAPDAAARIATDDAEGSITGRVVAWEHGTLGLTRRCMPSEDPANLIWGPTPWGINTVAWGTEAAGNQRAGRPEDGILAGMTGEGWIVTATDYYVDRWGGDVLQPYVLGRVEAANTIDNIRAAHHLLRAVYGDLTVDGYDIVMWGHSQGGHAALWSGQLLESYTRATASPEGPPLALSGVAVEAPGSNFVTQPGSGDTGFGLFDWLAHAELSLTGVPEPIPVAPFFLSYVFAAWARASEGGRADPSEVPAYPDTGPLDIAALVRPEALATVEHISRCCWADGEAVAELVAPYRNRPFLTPEVGDGDMVDGLRHGRFDAACAGDPSPAVAAWREWITWNLPGPLGTSPLDKLPMRGDRLVPVMIAAGANDSVVHCVACGTGGDEVPAARDCMAVALYEALKTAYCPEDEPRGYLALEIWQPEQGVTAADHSDIRGLNASAGTDDPRFAGSPLHRFIIAAFEGTLAPGCTVSVVNGEGVMNHL